MKEIDNSKKLLKPKIDVVFHALFREENKHLLEELISSILKEKVKVKTTDKNRYLEIKNSEEKLGIMDLRAELEGNKQCIIEIQLKQYSNENDRILYYWANSYQRQLLRGKDYKTLNKTISIVILDHEIEELKNIENLGVKWKIRDDINGNRILTDKLEIVIIEIPKAIRKYKENKKESISQWMMFLDNPNNEEVSQIMENNKGIKEAVEELEKMNDDDTLRRIAELREKAIRDDKAAMDFAIEKGMQKGIEKGIEKVAKEMLKAHMDIEQIIKVTKLNRETLEKIKKEV